MKAIVNLVPNFFKWFGKMLSASDTVSSSRFVSMTVAVTICGGYSLLTYAFMKGTIPVAPAFAWKDILLVLGTLIVGVVSKWLERKYNGGGKDA